MKLKIFQGFVKIQKHKNASKYLRGNKTIDLLETNIFLKLLCIVIAETDGFLTI